MIVHSKRRAISLIELLVALGIIGLLMGLLISAVVHARHAAYRMECSNHLRQIGLALHQYHDGHGQFPPGCSFANGKDPFPFMSWAARLLPFLEQEQLWLDTERAYAIEPLFAINPPHVGFGMVMPVFTCPADSRTLSPAQYLSFRVGLSSYLGVEGLDQWSKDGVLFLDSRVRIADITDGTSNTLMVGERPPSADLGYGWWYAGRGQANNGSADTVLGANEEATIGRPDCPEGPYQFGPGEVTDQCDTYHFWSLHAGGAHFLFADGSVHFLPYSAAPFMPALATRAGGEAVTLPDE